MTKVLTPTSPEAYALDVLGLAPEQTIPNSVLVACTTKAGEVEGDDVFVRVPAINLDDSTGFVPEGDDIPEADPDLSELVIATGEIRRTGSHLAESSWRNRPCRTSSVLK